MFIKWREVNRPLTAEEEAKFAHLRPAWVSNKPRNPLLHRWYAYLAESTRVEGKPRQKIITYLASIPVCQAQAVDSEEWRSFWYKAHCSLSLVRVGWRTYHHAMSELGKRVEQPSSDDELARIVSEEYQLHPRWHKDYEPISKAIEWSQCYFSQ